MAITAQNNIFTSYSMTPEELALAASFTPATRALLQNLISEAAHLRIAMLYDPANPIAFAQDESYNKGKIDILMYLLELADSDLAASYEDFSRA